MRKGILGGTFDPIHNGHLFIAHEAVHELQLDQLIFMPSGRPPHKTNKDITEGSIRYGLIETAIRNEPKFDISDYELKKNGLSFTYQTVEYFKQIDPDTEWFFITGVDCLMELSTWRNVDRIFKVCNLVVFNRSGYNKGDIDARVKELEALYQTKINFLNIPILEISSTYIRKSIQTGKTVRPLVPESVYQILLELGLYKQEEPQCGQK